MTGAPRRRWFTGGVELPPRSLDLGVPSDRCLVFLPGFACPPHAYRSFLAPVALRVGRVVVLGVGALGAQVTGRSTPGNEAVRTVETVDRLRADGVQVWLGGHSRGGLVAWHAAPMARASRSRPRRPGLGRRPAVAPTEPPPPIEPDGPVTVIGFGLGGRCAPPGRNHETFVEALPAATHVVVDGCAHADILDGAVGRFGRLTCGHAPIRAAAEPPATPCSTPSTWPAPSADGRGHGARPGVEHPAVVGPLEGGGVVGGGVAHRAPQLADRLVVVLVEPALEAAEDAGRPRPGPRAARPRSPS